MPAVSDDAFAQYVNSIGNATFEQIEAAKALQAERAKGGVVVSLGDVLVEQGILTPQMRHNVENKLLATEKGQLKQIGNYKLLKKIGEGGMGAVFLADEISSGRRVAVKILPPQHASDVDFLARFRREAKATSKLSHENIVAAYAVGEEFGTHYYAMEFIDGEPLNEILKRDGALPWQKALEIVMQIARGLKFAHDNGFIHRDIKPANVVVMPALDGDPKKTGLVKILDMGLTKNIGESDTELSFNTQTGVSIGTPHYVSPEQVRAEKTIDGRADIYSLGATFYHLVAGQPPFTGDTAAVILHKHLSEEIPNPQKTRLDIPTPVIQVIRKMMCKLPAARYANCQELLLDLEILREGKTPPGLEGDFDRTNVGFRASATAQETRPVVKPDGTYVFNDNEVVSTVLLPATRNKQTAVVPKPGEKRKTAWYAVAMVLLLLAGAWSLFSNDGRPGVPQKPAGNTAAAKPPAPVELPKEIALDLGGGVKLEMVLVPAGEFTMGDQYGNASHEKHEHKVKLTKSYYIAKYETTVAQYKAFAAATNYRTEAEKAGNAELVIQPRLQQEGLNFRNAPFPQDDTHPATCITWNDAVAFGIWASDRLEGLLPEEKTEEWAVRLPTEAEWEYAARGTKGTRYPWGDTWSVKAGNCADASLRKAGYAVLYGETKEDDGWAGTSPAGHYKEGASWVGAFDMAGNVWEWTQDWFDNKYYETSPENDPPGPASGKMKVFRGSCFNDAPQGCRSTQRGHAGLDHRSANFGFRVVAARAPLKP